jgi:hypothetical protein
MSLILDGSNGVSDIDGTAATPAIRGTDANTGIFFPAADTIAFSEGGTESARFDSAGNVILANGGGYLGFGNSLAAFPAITFPAIYGTTTGGSGIFNEAGHLVLQPRSSGALRNIIFATGNPAAERMRITAAGDVLLAKTASAISTVGCELLASGAALLTRDSNVPLIMNRLTNDGDLVSFRQASTQEGTISVSGTTVSYNGGHLARWSQLPDGSKDETILKGTVLSNLDEMCVWEKDGVVAANEQLNKMKVSDVEGDTNVAGVFVNWTKDEDYNSDDMNIAMTGDMIIRIADGVVVKKGDLLMSAGDGTAKPQGDDIVRSKTIAKVTSNHVTCTYADGSYCVPCVLMAC